MNELNDWFITPIERVWLLIGIWIWAHTILAAFIVAGVL